MKQTDAKRTDARARPTEARGRPLGFQPYLGEDARLDAQAAGAGLSTGFTALDAEGVSWKPGQLYLVAGQPGEGNTTFLLELLLRHVEDRDRYPSAERGPAVFVSYEENRFRLFVRLLQRACIHPDSPPGAPPRAIAEEWLRTGEVVAHDPRAADWAEDLARARRRLDGYGHEGLLAVLNGDRVGPDVEGLLNTLWAAQQARGQPPSLLVVDDYQKVRPPRELRRASRAEQLREVADQFRRYAKGERDGEDRLQYAVPVVVGARVDWAGVQAREAFQPELHNLREAEELANDATAVLTIHRPGADRDGQPFHVKVVKNRDGRRDGTAELGFYGSWGHVADQPDTSASWS